MGWRRGLEGAVVALLLLPAAVHGRQQDPAAELLAAAADGRWQEAIALLDAGAPATARTADDWTVLHYAARDGWLNLLDRALAAGAAPAAATRQGYTPLELAAFNGRAMVVAMLLDVLPDTTGLATARDRVRDAQSRLASEPPADAAEAERRRRQLESTARVLDDAGYARDLRLTRAAATGDAGRIGRLLNEGASPSAVDPWDYPALILAAGGNHDDVAIALLRAGADPDVAAPDGWTALHFAARDGRSELLAALLQAGAEPTPREPGEVRKPLWLAAFNGNVTAALVLLAAQEWSTTATAEAADGAAARLAATGDGAPSAALRGRLEQMQTMLAGLDVASGAQPTQVAGVLLTRAVDMALDEAVSAMLAADVDAGAIGPAGGRTPLHAAAARGDTLVGTFLRAGATTDPVTAEGRTPLMLAAEAGHLPTVLMLYMHGADARRADAGGLTAGDRAAAAGQDAAARLLAVLAPADTAPPGGDLPALAGTRPDSVMPPAEALEHAVIRGDDELAGVLLDMGLPAQERVRTVREVGEGTTLLMLAADSGRVAVAGALMDAGADVYARDHAGRTALRRAALAGHHDVVRLLASRTLDLDATDAEGLTDLEWAARSGLGDVAALLLEAGASPVANADGARWLPIHTAARDGHDLLLDALIAAGSPLDAADEEGRTPLMLAAYNGNNYGVAALMMALGPGAGRDATRRAIEFARPLALQLTDSLATLGPGADDGGIASYLADIESVLELLGDSRRAAAALLMMQAYRGKVESVEALLSGRVPGLDPESGHWGRTPLINAALGGQAGTAAVLLQAGARPDPVDSRGWTALHYAARDGRHDLLDLLLAHGADPGGGGQDEMSPLMLAAYNGNLYGVSALLRRLPDPAPAIAAAREFAAARHDELAQLAVAEAGAERDRLEGLRVRVDDALRLLAAPHDATGALLGSAAWFGRLDVVARLLGEGVDPDAETLLNRSALVLAAEQGHTDVAIALLQAGADPTAPGHNGWSALHVAARDGLDEFIEAAVRQPVTPDLATPEGYTPLYLAVHNRRDAIVAALLAAGADADRVVDGESIRRRVATDWDAPESVRAALETRAPRWAQPDTLTTAFLQAMGLRLPFQDEDEP
ncbi:MAG TPA: ankyrin repeat domain-containing protein, partial [Longimicrobiales bacterium]|nr:ankyrin repeat domain-containing protein [Longimicrobiales bacterium]